MYEIAAAIAVTLLCIIVIPNIVVELDKLCSRLDELAKCRKRRKYLLSEYRKWYDKAMSCDNFGGAVDKGRAVAMLAVIGHEIAELEKR